MNPQPSPLRPGFATAPPFTVDEIAGTLRIVLAKDAGLHPGLAASHARLRARSAGLPVLVDFVHITLLNSAILGWIFALIHDGDAPTVTVVNANRTVRAQMDQVGLAGMVVFG